MKSRDDTEEAQRPSAGAGLAGAGGGTLLTVVASSMPDGHPLKPWVLYLAPSAAVLLSAVWLWIQRKIASHFREREVRALFESAKAALQSALNNPNTTPEHRKRLQSQLEELEMLDVGRVVKRIKSLEILDTSDIRSSEPQAGAA